MKVILASNSPRRKEILQNQNVKFDVLVSNINEFSKSTLPSEIVCGIAKQKAFAVKNQYELDNNCLIIAADTLVFAGGEVLGKPNDKEDAKRMITLLSDSTHQVFTGIALIYNNNILTDSEETIVEFNKMSEEEIENYINSSEPYDKAGGYAVQGLAAKYIKRIDGCYNNVVGLPISKFYQMLKQLGLENIF